MKILSVFKLTRCNALTPIGTGILFVLSLLSCNIYASETTELYLIKEKLKQQKSNLDNYLVLYNFYDRENIANLLQKNMMSALTYAKTQRCLSAERELEYVLSMSQIGENLAAHPIMLAVAQCYLQEKNTHSAFRYAKMVLRYSQTKSDAVVISDALHIFSQVTSLTSNIQGANDEDITFLNNISVPKAAEPDRDFVTAQLVVRYKNPSTADYWLNSLQTSGRLSETDPRNLYLKGVLALKLKNYEQSALHFQSGLPILKQEQQDLRDLFNMGLARLQSIKKNQIGALSLYKLIEKESPYYGQSLFEQMINYIEIDAFAEALAIAIQLSTEKNLHGQKAKFYLPYLKLRSGKWDEAKGDLEANFKYFEKIKLSLADLNKTNISSFLLASDKELGPWFDEQMDNLLAKKTSELRWFVSIKNEFTAEKIRWNSSLIEMAKTKSVDVLPFYQRRLEQLSSHFVQLMDQGSSLLNSYLSVTKNSLTPIEQKKIELLSERLSELKGLALKREMRLNAIERDFRRVSQLKYLQLLLDDTKTQSARLASISLTKAPAKRVNADDLGLRLKQIKEQIEKQLTNVSQKKLAEQSEPEGLLAFRKHAVLMAHTYWEIWDFLLNSTSTDQIPKDLVKLELASGYQSAFKLWQDTFASFLTNLSGLEGYYSNFYAHLLERQAHINRSLQKMEQKISRLEQRSQGQIEKNLAYLKNGILRQIEREVGKQKKWAADYHLFYSDTLRAKQKNLEGWYEIKQMILKEEKERLQLGKADLWPIF